MRKLLLFCSALLMTIGSLYAQETTSSLMGSIKDVQGKPLIGATVKATDVPSGTVYGTVSLSDGRFVIPNMKVGGPYKIEVSYIGYVTRTYSNLYLTLGTPLRLPVVLEDNSKTLSEVQVVYNKNAIISPEHTGTSTNISQQELQDLPTVSRSIADFARLNPEAVAYSSSSDGSSMGISFAGQNNRYNQFTVDGANATDVFGLAASGTNGGQAGINPIPLEAIQQVQVVLSPYDVKQGGFTGGGINAVTKSGTNTFHGSAYTYYQNQSMVGKSVTSGQKYANFTNKTYGLSLGGPIIKNKLFFYADGELYKKSQPLPYNPLEPGTTSKFDPTTLGDLRNFIKNTYGYDPGSYGNFNKNRSSHSVFARIDWNINEKNKLTLRHSYVDGSDYNIGRTPTSITYGNGGYNFKDVTNSTVLELNSNFSSKLSNMFRFTFNAIRDKRASSPLFPSVQIRDNGLTYNFGGEQYSSANKLNQNNYTLTDYVSLYKGKHSITIGTDNQFYNTTNVFLRAFYGDYVYNSISDFESNALPREYHVSYSTKGGSDLAPAKVHFAQLGLYAQDEWSASSRFRLTYGIRADLPVYFQKPSANPTFNSSTIATSNGVATNKVPKSRILLSPRVGFNYDVNGNGATQLRGGIGLFTGRVPFVWISNQYSNTGVESIKYDVYSSSALPAGFKFNYNPSDPNGHLGAYIPANPTSAPSEIDVTSPDFKLPQILRSNLAIDQKLPWNVVGTFEAVFTKTLNDINYKDINLQPSTNTETLGNTTRPQYSGGRIDPNFANVIMLYNTNKGYSYDFTLQFQRPFSHGFTASIAYSIGHAKSVNDGTSSQALSNWRYVYNINGLNYPDLATSNYDPGSRIIGYVTKNFQYGRFNTTVGLVYTGISGQPFSYLYYNDVNGDNSASNDLMYVPANQQEAQLTNPAQWTALDQFISSNKYLNSRRGKNTARNGDRTPFESHFDLKLAEGWKIYKTHRLDLTLNIFNVANLLDKKWGRAYIAPYQEVTPVTVDKKSNWSASNVPSFTFNPAYATDSFTGKVYSIADFTSRWNMQLGLRYSF